MHFVQKYGDASVLARAYLKDQLVSLCQAYEVNFRRSDTKKVLATTLVEGMRNKRAIPFIGPVDDRQFRVVETVADQSIGSVRMTFRLSGKYLMIFILLDISFHKPEEPKYRVGQGQVVYQYTRKTYNQYTHNLPCNHVKHQNLERHKKTKNTVYLNII